MNSWLYAIGALIALIFSYFFTYVQNSYHHLTEIRCRTLVENHPKKGAYVRLNFEQCEDLYGVTVVLDYLANLIVGVLATLFFDIYLWPWGPILGIAVSLCLILIFGELLPRSLGKRPKDSSLLRHGRNLYVLTIIFRPLLYFVRVPAHLILKLLGREEQPDPRITEEEILQAVTLGHAEGLIDNDEKIFMDNIMELRSTYAKDVMTPRTDIVGVDVTSSVEDIRCLVEDEGFSRMPVYDKDLDNILGILHIKDILMLPNPESFHLEEVLRPSYFTYEYKPLLPLFNELRQNKLSIAIVLDEYGGTAGLLSVEDIVEELMGSISDEYDEDEEEEIRFLGGGRFLVEGSANLSLVNHTMNTELESEDYDTIAGYIIEHIDRFPETGETIEIGGLRCSIKKASRNRIESVILQVQE